MKQSRGFTLIEVLVALTLFALVGGSLLALVQTGLRTTALGNEYTHAALLARSKLTELQVYTGLRPGIYEGEFDERFRWQLTFTERQEDAEQTLLEQIPMDVTIAVTWGEGNNQKSVDLQTVLLSSEADR
jgi:general secretion pathway protein I